MAEAKESKESKEPKKAAKAKPIADVAQPGKTPPSDNSRAIITHRTLMKDPMVVAEDQPDETEGAQPASQAVPKTAVGGERKLQPLNETIAEAPASETPPAADETPKDQAQAEASTDTGPEAEKDSGTESSDAGINQDTDTGSSTGSSDKPVPGELEAAEIARQEQHDTEMQKLVDSKKYFLPVNAVERRRSKRFIALGILLSLFLAAAWLDIALDANLVKINGIEPVTHFFST